MATQTPNKDRLRMWASALKSGQYQQGNGHMRTSDGKYCCLGVAMDIALANGVQATGTENWGKTKTMPGSVVEWYGLPLHGGDPVLCSPEEVYGRGAASLNDNGVPFTKIADRIIYTYGLDQGA